MANFTEEHDCCGGCHQEEEEAILLAVRLPGLWFWEYNIL